MSIKLLSRRPVNHRLICLIALILGMLCAETAFAAGAMSHYYIGKRTADKLVADPTGLPDPYMFQDKDAYDAFCCGAVSPDLDSFNIPAHNEKTTATPTKLRSAAANELDEAYDLPDDNPDKAQKLAAARRHYAFALGWLSHVATDLNVHPEVNKIAGDAFVHNSLVQKGVHMAQEVQLDYYVDSQLRAPGEKIDYTIPFDFISKCTGIFEDVLRSEVSKMRLQIAAEVVGKKLTDVEMETLRKRWKKVLDASIDDGVDFAEAPQDVKDWDLDVGGGMTTQEFEDFRDLAIEANGGTLPDEWGKNYIAWHNKIKGCKLDKAKEVLAALIKGLPIKDDPPKNGTSASAGANQGGNGSLPATTGGTSDTNKPAGSGSVIVRRSDGVDNLKVWVNGRELGLESGSELAFTGCSQFTIKVMVNDPQRFDWTLVTKFKKGAKIEEADPYYLRYRTSDAVCEWNLEKERFNWFIATPTTLWNECKEGVSDSGVNPAVKGDVMQWTVPMENASVTSRKDSLEYAINAEPQYNWRVITTQEGGSRQSKDAGCSGGGVTLKIRVPVRQPGG